MRLLILPLIGILATVLLIYLLRIRFYDNVHVKQFMYANPGWKIFFIAGPSLAVGILLASTSGWDLALSFNEVYIWISPWFLLAPIIIFRLKGLAFFPFPVAFFIQILLTDSSQLSRLAYFNFMATEVLMISLFIGAKVRYLDSIGVMPVPWSKNDKL